MEDHQGGRRLEKKLGGMKIQKGSTVKEMETGLEDEEQSKNECSESDCLRKIPGF